MLSSEFRVVGSAKIPTKISKTLEGADMVESPKPSRVVSGSANDSSLRRDKSRTSVRREISPDNKAFFRGESSLHSSIRNWYSLPGDKFNVKIDGFIVDMVRDRLLIEIQTRNFSAIRKKLWSLVKNHNVRLVYPIAKEKSIVLMPMSGDRIIRRRRSPKRGRLTDLFDELMRIPHLFAESNFTLEVLMIREEEIRCQDGKGSWRRKGVSIKDRKLIDIVESIGFTSRTDFLRFLPKGLPQPFSNRSLAENIGVSVRQSRKITYCLKKMGVIKEIGKNGKELLFQTIIQ